MLAYLEDTLEEALVTYAPEEIVELFEFKPFDGDVACFGPVFSDDPIKPFSVDSEIDLGHDFQPYMTPQQRQELRMQQKVQMQYDPNEVQPGYIAKVDMENIFTPQQINEIVEEPVKKKNLKIGSRQKQLDLEEHTETPSLPNQTPPAPVVGGFRKYLKGNSNTTTTASAQSPDTRNTEKQVKDENISIDQNDIKEVDENTANDNGKENESITNDTENQKTTEGDEEIQNEKTNNAESSETRHGRNFTVPKKNQKPNETPETIQTEKKPPIIKRNIRVQRRQQDPAPPPVKQDAAPKQNLQQEQTTPRFKPQKIQKGTRKHGAYSPYDYFPPANQKTRNANNYSEDNASKSHNIPKEGQQAPGYTPAMPPPISGDFDQIPGYTPAMPPPISGDYTPMMPPPISGSDYEIKNYHDNYMGVMKARELTEHDKKYANRSQVVAKEKTPVFNKNPKYDFLDDDDILEPPKSKIPTPPKQDFDIDSAIELIEKEEQRKQAEEEAKRAKEEEQKPNRLDDESDDDVDLDGMPIIRNKKGKRVHVKRPKLTDLVVNDTADDGDWEAAAEELGFFDAPARKKAPKEEPKKEEPKKETVPAQKPKPTIDPSKPVAVNLGNGVTVYGTPEITGDGSAIIEVATGNSKSISNKLPKVAFDVLLEKEEEEATRKGKKVDKEASKKMKEEKLMIPKKAKKIVLVEGAALSGEAELFDMEAAEDKNYENEVGYVSDAQLLAEREREFAKNPSVYATPFLPNITRLNYRETDIKGRGGRIAVESFDSHQVPRAEAEPVESAETQEHIPEKKEIEVGDADGLMPDEWMLRELLKYIEKEDAEDLAPIIAKKPKRAMARAINAALFNQDAAIAITTAFFKAFPARK